MSYEGFLLPRMPRQRKAEVVSADYHPVGEWGTEVARANTRHGNTGEQRPRGPTLPLGDWVTLRDKRS